MTPHPTRTIVYTLGWAQGYDSALAAATEEDPLVTVGRNEEYEGGWIFETWTDAVLFLISDDFAERFPDRDTQEFSVYEIRLPNGWAEDVSPEPHESDGVHRLLVDAPIVGKFSGA